MYYYIKGTLVKLSNAFAVIDAGGVGYKLWVTQLTYAHLASLLGKEAMLYTYLRVAEDAEELFGFADEDERDTFVKLLTVSGVGPKAASSILSLYSPDRLASLIMSGDDRSIAKASGVGVKTAQRIIIELKGKLDLSSDSGDSSAGGSLGDALNTLIVLGYTRAEAEKALKGVDPTLPLEDIITLTLKKLNKF